MPTIISKDIGGGANDYATIAAWVAGAASTYPGGLVTNDVIWKGNLYPGGGGSNGEWLTAQVDINGTTTACDATRYFHLAAATGQSFNDNASKATNALRYNPANGVAVRTNTASAHLFSLSNNAVLRLTGLQLHNNQTADPRHVIAANTGIVFVENCILKGDSSSYIIYSVGNLNPSFVNTVFYTGNSSSRAMLFGGGGSHSPSIRNCTFFGAGAASALQLSDNVQATMKNSAVFGFTAVADDTTRMNGAACNNNATDVSSVGFGSSNQTSLTASAQFENVSSGTEDFRAKSTGALPANGVRDAAATGDLDILKQTRSLTTPTIGVFEVVVPDTQAPTVPGTPTATAAGTTQLNFSWSASTDNVGVTAYDVQRYAADGTTVIDVVSLGNVTTYSWTGLTASSTRGIKVRARDAAGNVSAYTTNVVSGTTSATSDTSPPNAVTGTAISAITTTTATVTWNATTDNGGGVVAGYKVRLLDADNADAILSTTTVGNVTSHQVTGLTPSHNYKVQVSAFDNAATPNEVAFAAAVAFTTAAGSTTLYARATMNRPNTLSDPGYPAQNVTVQGFVTRGWPTTQSVLLTAVPVTFTVGAAQAIAAPMPALWGDNVAVAAGQTGFYWLSTYPGTGAINSGTHGQQAGSFTVGA